MTANNVDVLSDPKKNSQTPWGQSWADLIRTLRPSPHDDTRIAAICATIARALKSANLSPERYELGGPVGCDTHSRHHVSVQVYAVYGPGHFHPADYLDLHLEPIYNAIVALDPQPLDVTRRGLAVTFILDDIPVALYAAGELPAGPAQLAYQPPEKPLSITPQATTVDEPYSVKVATPQTVAITNPGADTGITMDERSVHADTTCAVLRAAVLKTQPTLFKDMVRIGRKWLNDQHLDPADRPSDYLLHLLMLAAVRSTPIGTVPPPCASENNDEWNGDVTPDTYRNILRRMLHIASLGEVHHGDTIYSDASPASASPLFLWWPLLYDRPVIEHCMATWQLSGGDRQSGCALCVVDLAAPWINVARTLGDWRAFREAARAAALALEQRSTVQTLQDRLRLLSEGFEESVGKLRSHIQSLQAIENAPRRWTGTINFTEAHLVSEKWISILEVNLRTYVWRVNVRRTRNEGMGYSTTVDLSLQMVSDATQLTKTLDVDVVFRNNSIYLTFDKDSDHVFLQKRCDVVRNRDYPLQITVVA